MDNASELPQRVIRIDFGDKPRHPVIRYTAPAHVIARFVSALKDWEPSYHVRVESVERDYDQLHELPCWRLFESPEGNN